MGAMRAVWIGTVAAGAVAVAVVLVIATHGSEPRLEPMPLRTSLEHSVVGFGDPVHAHAAVVLDKGDRERRALERERRAAGAARAGPSHARRRAAGVSR